MKKFSDIWKKITITLISSSMLGLTPMGFAAEVDSDWYLSQNPDVAKAIKDGTFQGSAQDHYDRFGSRDIEKRFANREDKETWVRGFYDSGLGRSSDGDNPPDDEGVNYWVDNTSSGGEERLGDSIFRAAIENIYEDMLGRPADKAGAEYWFNDMKNEGHTVADIRGSIEQSDEYISIKTAEEFSAIKDAAVGITIDENGDAIIDPLILLSMGLFFVDSAMKFETLDGESKPDDLKEAQNGARAYTTSEFISFRVAQSKNATISAKAQVMSVDKTQVGLLEFQKQTITDYQTMLGVQIFHLRAASAAYTLAGVIAADKILDLDDRRAICDERALKAHDEFEENKNNNVKAALSCAIAEVEVLPSNLMDDLDIEICKKVKLKLDEIEEVYQSESTSKRKFTKVEKIFKKFKKSYKSCLEAESIIAPRLSRMLGKAAIKLSEKQNELTQLQASLKATTDAINAAQAAATEDEPADTSGLSAQVEAINSQITGVQDKISKINTCQQDTSLAAAFNSGDFKTAVSAVKNKCKEYKEETEKVAGKLESPTSLLKDIVAEKEFNSSATAQEKAEREEVILSGAADTLVSMTSNGSSYSTLGEKVLEVLDPISVYTDLFLFHPISRIGLWEFISSYTDSIIIENQIEYDEQAIKIANIQKLIDGFNRMAAEEKAARERQEAQERYQKSKKTSNVNVASASFKSTATADKSTQMGLSNVNTDGVIEIEVALPGCGKNCKVQKGFSPGTLKILGTYLSLMATESDAIGNLTLNRKSFSFVETKRMSDFGQYSNAVKKEYNIRKNKLLKRQSYIKYTKKNTTSKMFDALNLSLTKNTSLFDKGERTKIAKAVRSNKKKQLTTEAARSEKVEKKKKLKRVVLKRRKKGQLDLLSRDSVHVSPEQLAKNRKKRNETIVINETLVNLVGRDGVDSMRMARSDYFKSLNDNNKTQINLDSGESIFKLISTRYKKTALKYFYDDGK